MPSHNRLIEPIQSTKKLPTANEQRSRRQQQPNANAERIYAFFVRHLGVLNDINGLRTEHQSGEHQRQETMITTNKRKTTTTNHQQGIEAKSVVRLMCARP